MKGQTKRLICIVVVNIMLGVLCTVEVIGAHRRNQTANLKQYLNIELPQGGFSWVERDLLQPAVEKRLKELQIKSAKTLKAETVVMDKSNVLAVADANKYFQDFRKAQNEAARAYWDMRKACEAAKFFKLVSD